MSAILQIGFGGRGAPTPAGGVQSGGAGSGN